MSISHDTQTLPSIRAMRAFTAAARLGSFTAAAAELNVTQGAVSRQVQELEGMLSIALFRRNGPKLQLTDAGRSLAADLEQALSMLRDAVLAARNTAKRPFITLSTLPSVAAKWLAPRLGKFIAAHPDIDLRVSASRQLADLARDGVDAALRYGKGAWPGLHAEHLGDETVAPVCAPDYARALGLRRPDDLYRATLLPAEIAEDWPTWFSAAGLSTEGLNLGPSLGDEGAILQAVIDKQGVALGRSVLVAEDLKSGRLIQPFHIHLPASSGYWFVTSKENAPGEDLIAVRDWFRAEFSQTAYTQR